MSDKYKELRKLIRESLAEEINEMETQTLASQQRSGFRGSSIYNYSDVESEEDEDEDPVQLFDISVDEAKYLNKLEGRSLFSIILSDRLRTNSPDYEFSLEEIASTYENARTLPAVTKLKIKKSIKFLLDNNIDSIEQYDEFIKSKTQATSEETAGESIEEKINLLLNKRVNIEGKDFSVAGVLAMAAATKNFAPSLRLENVKHDQKLDARKAKHYLVIASIADNFQFSDAGKKIQSSDLLSTLSASATEKLRKLTVEVNSDFNFDVIKGYVTSGAGFMYEVAIGEMLGINDELINKELDRNKNRTAGFYAYYAAHLENEVNFELTPSGALFRILSNLERSSDEIDKFFKDIEEIFDHGEEKNHLSLKNRILEAIRLNNDAVNYIKRIKETINALLGDDPTYKFHTSPGGTFDIQASTGDGENIKSISFDVKATRQSSSEGEPIPILKPSDRSINKWEKDEIKSDYYGILNVLLKDFDISLSYALAPREEKPLAGGLVFLQELLKDLNDFINEPDHKLKYFKAAGRKTYAKLEIPRDLIDREFFKVTGEESITGEESSSLTFSNVINQLEDRDLIFIKIKPGTIKSDIEDTLKAAIEDHNPEIYDDFVLLKQRQGKGFALFNAKFIKASASDRKVLAPRLKKSKYFYFLNHLANLIKELRSVEDEKVKKYLGLKLPQHTNVSHAITAMEKVIAIQDIDVDGIDGNENETIKLKNYLSSKSSDKTELLEFARYLEMDIIKESEDKTLLSTNSKALIRKILRSINRIYFCLKVENSVHGRYRGSNSALKPDVTEETSDGVDDSHNISGSPLLEKVVRSLVRNILQEADKKSYSGSHPEESYGWSAKEEDFMFDKPGLTTWEEDRKWVKQYLKSMGLLAKK